MVNSNNINDLHPVVRNKAKAHQDNCRKRGIDIIFTSTYRDNEFQASLYEKGRTKPGGIVTNMKVTAAHGKRLAYDVVPVINGEAIWDRDDLWKIVGQEGKRLGMSWGGDWRSLIDKSHFELTDGLSSSQIISGILPEWYGFKELKDYVEYRTGFHRATIDFFRAYKYEEGIFTKLS